MQQHTQSIALRCARVASQVQHAVVSECDYLPMNNIIPTHIIPTLDTKFISYSTTVSDATHAQLSTILCVCCCVLSICHV